MAKDWAVSFYKSAAWDKCREGYISSVHGLCERCTTPTPGKIVHHKEYLTPENIIDPNITLNWELLEYLCQRCHNNEHHGDGKGEGVIREGLMFDEYGNLVEG